MNKFIILLFSFLLICINSATVHSARTTFGETIVIDTDGNDPDVAVDSEGSLHFAYVIGGSTYYRKVLIPYTDPENIGDRFFVGNGVNPQIALDSLDNPHVVFGQAHYAYWVDPGFTQAGQAFDGWRKNLIAVDSKDQVYVVADRNSPRDVSTRVYKDGVPISDRYKVGDDNPGGIDFDINDKLWITWRVGFTYTNTYTFVDVPLGDDIHLVDNQYRFPNRSGDFSWCSVSPLDNSVHVVYTAAGSKGIYSSIRRDSTWKNLPLEAEGYGLDKEDRPDAVNPVSATDRDGFTYITFMGSANPPVPVAKLNSEIDAEPVGYYMVYNPNDELETLGGESIIQFDNNNIGAKMTNPNIASRFDMSGAYVSWGSEQVQVASIGDISFSKEEITPIVLHGVYFLLLK